MESMEARALKSSLLSEFSMKSNHQARQDDFCYVNGGNADDFSVDVFLDLSDDDLQGDLLSTQGTESVSSRHGVENYASNCSMFSDSFDSSLFPDEFNIPEDDFEDLEWLSRFADDYATELFPFSPTGISNRSPIRKPSIQSQSTPLFCFPVPVPAKTRTKRERPCGKVWSSSSSSSSNEPSFNKSEQNLLDLQPPAAKHKKKKKEEARVSPETVTEPAVGGKPQRRCTHCEVQKTPQWRRGPLGPKTLCNACGVRFKSGRLFPEYRPACSPTFSGEVHSNSHRRVLEMRSRNVTDVVVAVQS